MEQMSFQDRQRALEPLVRAKFPEKKAKDGACSAIGCWVRDIYDDSVIAENGGKTYRLGYAMTDKGPKLTSGPEEVTAHTEYEPVKGDKKEPASDDDTPRTAAELLKRAKLEDHPSTKNAKPRRGKY